MDVAFGGHCFWPDCSELPSLPNFLHIFCAAIFRVFNEKREDSTPDQFTYRLNTEILNGLIPAIVEHLGEEHSEYYRIGAVYFVYAVYMNQPPSVETVKVRACVRIYMLCSLVWCNMCIYAIVTPPLSSVCTQMQMCVRIYICVMYCMHIWTLKF